MNFTPAEMPLFEEGRLTKRRLTRRSSPARVVESARHRGDCCDPHSPPVVGVVETIKTTCTGLLLLQRLFQLLDLHSFTFVTFHFSLEVLVDMNIALSILLTDIGFKTHAH